MSSSYMIFSFQKEYSFSVYKNASKKDFFHQPKLNLMQSMQKTDVIGVDFCSKNKTLCQLK